jgi:hypothetical protein
VALIDYAFRQNAYVLQLTCKVEGGWRRATKTYCYHEECKQIELSGGATIRAQVSVFPLPVTLSQSAAEFKVSASHEGGGHDAIFWTLNRSSLTVEIRLIKPEGIPNDHLPWNFTNDKGKPCVKWESFAIDKAGSYRIALILVFNRPPNAPGPVEWEKGDGFLPGGLPSLGKRR